MLKQNDQVIVSSSGSNNYKVGTFIGYNEKVHGVKAPMILFKDGNTLTCFGHVIPYSLDLTRRLDNLTPKQQWELLTLIKVDKFGRKQFILMRGLPGSGKSTKAKRLAGHSGQVFSTDDYFTDVEGNYNYKREQVGTAHKWNQRRALAAFDAKIPVIVIDNTNTTLREMRAYLPHIEQAKLRGYQFRVEESDTHWRFDIDELFKRGTHNVPRDVLQKMFDRYHLNADVETICFR